MAVPLTKGKKFSELTFVGKTTYVSSVVGVVVGAIMAVWQGAAYAEDKAEEFILQVVDVEGIQQQSQYNFLATQNLILALQLSEIEAEVSSITRDKAASDLTAAEQERLNQLRDDRDRIRDQMAAGAQQQQQLQQQN